MSHTVIVSDAVHGNRVTGVFTKKESTLAADAVVVVAGPWTGTSGGGGSHRRHRRPASDLRGPITSKAGDERVVEERSDVMGLRSR